MCKDKKIKSYILKIVSVILIIIAIAILLKIQIVKDVGKILLISFVLAYTLNPVKKWIVEKFAINKSVAAAIIILGILGIFIGLIAFLIPSLINQSIDIEGIVNSVTGFVENLMVKLKLNNYSVVTSMYEQSAERINMWIQGISMNALDYIVTITDNILSLAVIPIVIYYLLSDGKYIFDKILLILPTEKRGITKSIINDIDKVLGRYIFSQFLLCTIIGVFTFVGLLIIGVQFPLLLAIINGIFNIVPYFGPFIGAIPAVFIAFVGGGNKFIITIVFFFILQQIEGNILSPKITGDSISIHPIVIIILLLVGEEIGGFIGMIVAVPIGVIIKVIYEDINYHLF